MTMFGIRLGSPAGTTCGFGVAEFQQIGNTTIEALDGVVAKGEGGDAPSRRRRRSARSNFAGVIPSTRNRGSGRPCGPYRGSTNTQAKDSRPSEYSHHDSTSVADR